MNRVSKRYAKALFELALEEQLLGKIREDLHRIKQIFNENAGLSDVMSNPLVRESEKLSALRSILENDVQALTLNFLALLASRKRLSILLDVLERFELLILEYENKIEGELVSAVELSADQVEQIQNNVAQLTGKDVVLNQRLEPGLIGGFLVKVEDLIIDTSIRYQLNKLREKLIAR